jgi:two-component system response regulator AtoC
MQDLKNGRTILVGEDELEVRGYLEMALKCLGYSAELAQDGDEVLDCLQSSRSDFSAILLDIMMPNRDGIETLREIRRIDPDIPVIVISGAASPLNIVTAMKNGATDFLCKPVAHEDLRVAITRALATKSNVLPAKGNEYLPASRNTALATKVFIGRNPQMKEIQTLIGQIGWFEPPVLIQGETGSGKEMIARELHAQSPRGHKSFLKLNCAALPSELVESELFGYERGSFTGAFQKKAGMFEVADGGTILLDEIGDMDVRLQAKLLQVLQDHEFQRIGGKETIKVDVRVIAATHRDLEKAIAERSFREDLYYRLNVINIHVPPLRERREDIIPLAEFLMKKHALPSRPNPVITAELRQAMISHHWPGNVRELENFIRKFLILRDPEILARDLQTQIARKAVVSTAAPESQTVAPDLVADRSILEQVTRAKHQAETDAILATLNSTRWNRKQAAVLLKIDYKALLYKMKKLGIEDKPIPFHAATEATAIAATGG